MSLLLTAPILVPLTCAVLAYLLRERLPAARAVSLAGSVLLLVATAWLLARILADGPQAAQMGGWPAPFGITLVADLLSAIMALITGIIGVAVAVYAYADLDRPRERFGYHALYQVLLAGVCGAFLTGDLFNLYVWFEVMLIASFGLLVLGGEPEQLDGGIKYVALNLIATVSFLIGVGLLYGIAGTLNMADLRLALHDGAGGAAVLVPAALLLFAFGLKAAVFPLFFWLPASYHTPPVAVSAVFSALLTKVGVYALIRVFTLVFDREMPAIQDLLIAVSALTMLTGVLGAAAHSQIRRILSFHIVSQIGYMLLGLALFTPLALIGAIFYIVHHIIVKANLFLVAGVARRMTGSFELGRIGGLYAASPLVSILFLIPALSLAGIPPLSGFWAKLFIIQASFDARAWVVAGVALVVGLLTVYSMTKIWLEAFWKPHPAGTAVEPMTRREQVFLLGPIIGLAAITVVIGLFAEPFYAVSVEAAGQLVDPSAYVAAVLGARP